MLKNAVIAIVGILALGLWLQYLYVGHLQEMIEIERRAADTAQEATERAHQSALEALDELATAERQRRDAEAAVQVLQRELAAQGEEYNELRQRIRRAPASDDGPVAPVLRDTLERLP